MKPRSALISFSLIGALASGCGSGDNERLLEEAQGQNCGSPAKYTAFDPANHASQDARLQAQVAIATAADEAIADIGTAAAKFAEIEDLYATSAELQVKVQGRADDHFPDDPEAQKVGEAIDTWITDAIARGKAATEVADAKVAKQIIDKNLTRFFYLSTYHELVLGERAKYDEAYGYLGTGPDADPAKVLGVAKTASRRDEDNGTTYLPDLFTHVLAGSCTLDTRLDTDAVETIDWKSDAAFAAEVEALDRMMLEVLALSVGHEFFEPLSSLEPAEAVEKLYEGAMFFYAIEAAMRAKGGTAEQDAEDIAAALDAAMTAAEAGEMWQADFDSDAIKDKVAAAFGVTPKG